MRHFFRIFFTLGLLILLVAKTARTNARAGNSLRKRGSKAAPQATARHPGKLRSAKTAAAKPAPLKPQLKFESTNWRTGSMSFSPRTIGFL